MAHPMFAPAESGVAKTPWRAVQRAAWSAFRGGAGGDAPADRPRGLVELNAAGRRLRAERVPLHQVTFTGWGTGTL
jgi:hypothetical protein